MERMSPFWEGARRILRYTGKALPASLTSPGPARPRVGAAQSQRERRGRRAEQRHHQKPLQRRASHRACRTPGSAAPWSHAAPSAYIACAVAARCCGTIAAMRRMQARCSAAKVSPCKRLHHGEGHHVGGQRHGHPAQHASDGGERHDAGRTQALHERRNRSGKIRSLRRQPTPTRARSPWPE